MRTVNGNPQGRVARLFRGRTGLVYLAGLALLMFSIGYMAAPGQGGADGAESTHDHSGDPATWTCSMHPQIKLPEPGKCPICFMDLIPLAAGGEEMEERRLKMTEAAVKLASIRTSEVVRASASTEVFLSGKVAYDETRLTHLAAWMPGRIERMYADFTGERVSQGDPLVEIYSAELISSQQELLEASRVLDRHESSSNEALRTSAETTLKATVEKLRLLGLTSAQIDQIKNSDSASKTVTIFSNTAGTIIEKSVSEGMYVKAGSRLYSIADLSRVWINLDVSESDLPRIRPGDRVEFSTTALPGEKFVGQVTFIDPVVNDATRAVKVRLEADNGDFRLKPNMLVKGVLIPAVGADGESTPLLIPATAPLLTGTRAIVYVQIQSDSGHIFEGREIELGPRAGDYYVVESGLAEGDRVVTHGAFKIDSELQLQGRLSMMNPPEAPPSGLHGQMEKSSMPETVAVSSAVLDQMQVIYESYFAVQRGLADDDAKAAFKAAETMNGIVNGFDATILDDAARKRWNAFRDKSSEQIAQFDRDDISAQRVTFEHLSTAVIDLHDSFGHTGDASYFLTYCPMAFDNKGAYWLQDTGVVFNSYYGAAMLRCGSIKEEYQPASVGEK